MDFKKPIILIFCLLAITASGINKKKNPFIFIVIERLSCSSCNHQLNNYINSNNLKNRTRILLKDSGLFINSDAYYPKIKKSYDSLIFKKLNPLMPPKYSMKYPFIYIQNSTMEEIVSFDSLFINGVLNHYLLSQKINNYSKK